MEFEMNFEGRIRKGRLIAVGARSSKILINGEIYYVTNKLFNRCLGDLKNVVWRSTRADFRHTINGETSPMNWLEACVWSRF